MKYLFLATCLAVAPLFSSAANYVNDHLNDTYVRHFYKSEYLEENNFVDDEIYVSYPLLSENKWKGEAIINEVLRNKALEMAQSKEIYKEFMQYFYDNLEYYLYWYLNDFDENPNGTMSSKDIAEIASQYQPDEVEIDINLLVLNDHILVVSSNIYFEAKSTTRRSSLQSFNFEKLNYYDLNSGNEIDPWTMFSRDKREKLVQKAFSMSHDSLRANPAFLQEIRNSKPVFNGASFYMIVRGQSDASFKNSFNYHVRFPLAEIQPFLDEKGPYALYLDHSEEKPSVPINLINIRTSGGLWYNRDFYWIEDNELLMELPIRGGYKTARMYYKEPERERQVLFEYHYDQNGFITAQRSIDDGMTEDSINYIYYQNGQIRCIQYLDVAYMLEYSEDEDTVHEEDLYFFDELGNMILYKWIYDDFNDYFPAYIVIDYENVSYFGDKIIVDRHIDNPFGKGMVPNVKMYRIIEGLAFDAGKYSHVGDDSYSIVRDGDMMISMLTNNGKTYPAEYHFKNDKIISGGWEDNQWGFTVTYHELGFPVHYERFRTDEKGHTHKSVHHLELNKDKNPSRLIVTYYDNENETSQRIYEIDYEN